MCDMYTCMYHTVERMCNRPAVMYVSGEGGREKGVGCPIKTRRGMLKECDREARHSPGSHILFSQSKSTIL